MDGGCLGRLKLDTVFTCDVEHCSSTWSGAPEANVACYYLRCKHLTVFKHGRKLKVCEVP